MPHGAAILAPAAECEALGAPPPARFFQRSALALAPDLLGLLLCHETSAGLVAGRVVEVEAYCGPEDLAAHSARGHRSPRNEVMYGPAAHAYVYFIYGMHFCVNVVAATAGVPQAVLLRAVEPLLGLPAMRARRGARVADAALARGPGNLTRAFAIDRRHNGADLRTGPLRLLVPRGARAGRLIEPAAIAQAPRVGVAYAGEYAERPWRFLLRGHPSVSRPPRPDAVARRVPAGC